MAYPAVACNYTFVARIGSESQDAISIMIWRHEEVESLECAPLYLYLQELRPADHSFRCILLSLSQNVAQHTILLDIQ
jgi:hypothetical protein